MIAGKVPDIIDLAVPAVEAYVRQGILEDLRPYIQNDPAIDENNYFSNDFVHSVSTANCLSLQTASIFRRLQPIAV